MYHKNNSLLGNLKTNLLKGSFVFITLMLLGFNSHAKDYYFSSSSGNDSYSTTQAQNQSTPWKSLSKLNSIFNSLVAGDIIYFKRGDVFYGSIVATRSGSSSKPIVFTAYGSGSRPVISGLTTVNSWTSIGSNKYESTVSAASAQLTLVTVNGIPQSMGRYPNSSIDSDPYLYYETFAAAGGSITDNQLNTSTNWNGADVVIKKRRWVMDRCKITNHSGGTLTYNNPSSYPGVAGFGYYITNDPRTIDQFGEWYLNPSTKKLQIHFGGGQPTSYIVKISVVDNLVNLNSNKYITLRDLAFEGANVTGLNAQNGSNITIQQCDFTQMGKDGIIIRNSPNTLLENVNVNRVLNNGITVGNEYVNNTVIRNCNIKNIGMLAGMGASGDASYRGISVTVNSDCTVEYNNIDSIGYNALDFQGSNVTIRNNFINNYCYVKDDGGGIYTWANNGKSGYTNRKIHNNIVLNAKGVAYGTAGKTAEAKGIYLDGASMNVDIANNSIAHIARTGMLLNNVSNTTVNGNTVFNARYGVELVRLTEASQVRNIEMKRNVIYPRTSDQTAVFYKNFYLSLPGLLSIEADMRSIGTIDSNYYATPGGYGFGYLYCLNYTTIGTLITPPALSLEGWQNFLNKERGSKRPAKTTTNINDIRFEYNASTSAKTISLDAKYVGVDGTVYNGSITLQPYTSKVLVKDGPVTGQPPLAGKIATYATASPINCFGGNTTVTVTGSGGTAPYTGTGTFSVNAGKGSLKIDVPRPVSNAYTLLYSNIGSVSNSKYYVLKFSTIGSNGSGMLKAGIRQTSSPWSYITSLQNRSFGTSRVDHEFLFSAPTTTSAASFIIEILQSSGTVYVDNIAFFEGGSDGSLISNNLYNGGQFESTISNIYTWSKSGNHTASLDQSSKISNIYYYPVKDSKGIIGTAAAKISQPGSPLSAGTSGGTINSPGGTATVTVNAWGGTAPYTGTGNFYNVKAGTYNYTVTDAKGCTVVTTLKVAQKTSARVVNSDIMDSALVTSDAADAEALISNATSNLKDELSIISYPNPSTTDFNLMVEGGSREIVDISVISVDGKFVFRTQGPSNKKYTFGNNLMPGMYIIKVIQGKTMQTLKVVKTR